MSTGGTNRASVGNDINQQLNTIATGGGQFNAQLQGILGDYLSGGGSPVNQQLNTIATTGGYNPTQISAIEDQASQGARSAYDTASDTYSRAVMGSGGYGPSGSTIESLARKGSEAGGAAASGAAGNIAQAQVGNELSAIGLNSQQIQSLLNTILGNKSDTNAATNQVIGTAAGIATTPNPLWQNIASILGALRGAGYSSSSGSSGSTVAL